MTTCRQWLFLPSNNGCFNDDDESLLIEKTKLYLSGISTPSMSLIKNTLQIIDLGCNPGDRYTKTRTLA